MRRLASKQRRRNFTIVMVIHDGTRSRCFVRQKYQLRSEWEREFVTDMAGKTLYREPSEKQAKHLMGIFVKLGGYYDAKTVHLRR